MMNRSAVVAFSLVALSLVACSASTDSSDGEGDSEAAITTGSSGTMGRAPAGSDPASPAAPEDTAAISVDGPIYAAGTRCSSGAEKCIGLNSGDSCGGGKKCKGGPICSCI